MVKTMSDNQASQIAAALNIPMYATDLYMPTYRDGVAGRWKLMHGDFTLVRGYHSGLWGTWGLPVLLRNANGDGKTWETWMSLSPYEIETQELGCRYACGHTVVMGLGMGWIAANIALNPAVRSVTVIERDPEVIDLFTQAQAFAGLPAEAIAKLRIIEADALLWQPDSPVDFLYADIWRHLTEPRALDEVRLMQANVHAGAIYFWGQELAIHRLSDSDPETMPAAAWREAVYCTVRDNVALPLLLPEDFDYPALIAHVVKQRRQLRISDTPEV